MQDGCARLWTAQPTSGTCASRVGPPSQNTRAAKIMGWFSRSHAVRRVLTSSCRFVNLALGLTSCGVAGGNIVAVSGDLETVSFAIQIQPLRIHRSTVAHLTLNLPSKMCSTLQIPFSPSLAAVAFIIRAEWLLVLFWLFFCFFSHVLHLTNERF